MKNMAYFPWIILLLFFAIPAQVKASYNTGYANGFNQYLFNAKGDINPAYGNVNFTELDVQIHGKNGLSVNISRTYNSTRYNSNPTANIPMSKQWGAFAGNGWSFSVGSRAFIVMVYDEIKVNGTNLIASSNIIVDQSGSLTAYKYESGSSYSGDINYKSDDNTDFNKVEWDGTNKKITITTTNGIKYTYAEHFYYEHQEIDKWSNGKSTVVEVKGYYLSEINNLYDDKITYEYEEFDPEPYDVTRRDGSINQVSMTNIIGNIYNLIQEYLEIHTAYELNIHTTIDKIRLDKIKDTYDRTIEISYGNIGQNQNIENQKMMITQISYPNVNNGTNTLKYSYDQYGDLIEVQLNDLAAKEYKYLYFNPDFKLYQFIVNGYGIPRVSYEAETEELGVTPSAVMDVWWHTGILLRYRISPLGSVIEYEYDDCLTRNEEGMDIPNGSGAAVVRKKIYKSNTAGIPENLDYTIEYNYPKDDEDHLQYTEYTPEGSDSKAYYFATCKISYDFEEIGKSLEDETLIYEQGLEKETTKGSTSTTQFKTVNEWDHTYKRIASRTQYVDNTQKNKTTYGYDSFGNNTNQILFKGATSSNYTQMVKTYHDNTSNTGAWSNYLRHLLKTNKIVKSGNKNQQYYEYDAKGKLLKVYHGTDNTGTKMTDNSYYADGKLKTTWKKTKDNTGFTTTYVYDEDYALDGKAAIQTNVTITGGTTSYEKTIYKSKVSGQTLKVTDENDQTTTITYDNEGRVDVQTFPDGSSIDNDYSKYFSHNKFSRTINGIRTEESYHDSYGRTVIINNPTGEEDIKHVYYFGDTISKTYKGIYTTGITLLPSKEIVSQTYDGFLRPTTVSSNYSSTGYQYNDSTYSVTQTQFQGTDKERTVTTISNELDQLKTSSLTAGNRTYTTSYTENKYNAFGQAEETTDPRGLKHRFTTDTYGRTQYSYHTSTGGWDSKVQEVEYLYNGAGILKQQKIKNTSGTDSYHYSYGIDDFGRITSIDSSKFTGIEANNYYDEAGSDNSNGRLSRSTGTHSTSRFHYDEMGSLLKEEKTINQVNKTYTLEQSLDTFGLVDSFKIKDDTSTLYNLNYTYNSNQRVESIQLGTTQIASYEYLDNGAVDKMTLGSYTVDYMYHPTKEAQLVGIVVETSEGNVVTSQNYEYDEAGNIISNRYTDLFSLTGINRAVTYNFNSADELVNVQLNGQNNYYEWDYDLNGNRSLFKNPKEQGGFTGNFIPRTQKDGIYQRKYYNTAGTLIGTDTFSYDDEGNLITIQGNYNNNKKIDLTYNYQNCLTEVKKDNTTVVQYQYDIDRQKIYSYVPATGERKIYHWDFAGRIVGEGTVDASNQITNAFTKKYIYSGNQKIAMVFQNEIYYYFNNIQGTPLFISDSAGTIVQRFHLDPYGNLEKQTGIFSDELHFTGKKVDKYTNFIDFGQRWYIPAYGMWTSVDPKGQYSNPYLYHTNPVTYFDPNGEWFFTAALSWIPVVGTIAGAAIDAGLTAAAWNAGFQVAGHVVSEGGFNFTNFEMDWDSVGNSFVAGAIGNIAGGFTPEMGDSWWMNVAEDGLGTGIGNMINGSVGKDLSGVEFGNLFLGGVLEGTGQSLGNRMLDGISLTLGQEYNLSLADIKKQITDQGMGGAIVARALDIGAEHWGVEGIGRISGHVLGKEGAPLVWGEESGDKKIWRIVKMLSKVKLDKSEKHANASGAYNLLLNNCVHAAKAQTR